MLVLLIAGIVLLNALVTRQVVRDPRRCLYERFAEAGLIWLVPVFGALVSLCVSFDGSARVREYGNVMRSFGYSK